MKPTTTTTLASDGVPLSVRNWGNPDAPLTVVFVHGYCLLGMSWRQQIDHLLRRHDDIRAVTYDQRGHGSSGTPAPDSCTIAQLGDDLRAVLADIATPVITVGHSMGAMTLMAHAGQNPDQIGQQIVGSLLLSGAAQGLARAGVGAPWNRPLIDLLRWSLAVAPRPANTVKDATLAALGPILQRMLYGRKPVVRACRPADFIGATPLTTIAGFLHTLEFHDERDSLSVFGRIPTTIVAGCADLATPIQCSRRMASQITGARLVELPDTGHLVHMEHPGLIADLLSDLVTYACLTAEPFRAIGG